ncbi:MAG: hypothetical protein Q7S32_04785 [bacterium]|nr:hypothetical protein [bacterium]
MISSFFGELTIGPGVHAIRTEVMEILTAGVTQGKKVKLIIDLSQCTDIDSTGLAELTRSCAAVVQNGAVVHVCGPQSGVLLGMIRAKFAEVWEVHEDLESAKHGIKAQR